jgi:hypothetical protein
MASVVVMTLVLVAAAQAACTGMVTARGPAHLAAAVPEGAVAVTFLGHASFLIESPAGVRIVTGHNDIDGRQ